MSPSCSINVLGQWMERLRRNSSERIVSRDCEMLCSVFMDVWDANSICGSHLGVMSQIALCRVPPCEILYPRPPDGPTFSLRHHVGTLRGDQTAGYC